MTLKTRKIDGIVILDFDGRLTLGEPTFILRDLLREFLQNGYRKFIFNLADVSYLDSSGLGALIESFTSIRNRQGDIKLLNLSSKAKDLMLMTKLLTVFDTYTDESAALKKLK